MPRHRGPEIWPIDHVLILNNMSPHAHVADRLNTRPLSLIPYPHFHITTLGHVTDDVFQKANYDIMLECHATAATYV